jgi:3-hydroxymyristoyl/3-hydroxydecanoyl-(acyl carrier protein) dehydratase
MDIQEVLKYLPQRYPVLMIDRVKECEPGKRIVALKNVSANEPHFQGHFPGRPIMPGVLILEAMAQAAGVLVFSAEGAGAQRDRSGVRAFTVKVRLAPTIGNICHTMVEIIVEPIVSKSALIGRVNREFVLLSLAS